MHFLGYLEYDPGDNATRIMGYDPNTGEHQPFLVYYYYKQLGRGFHDGCVLRRSTCSDTREERYRTMCLTYGDKPAIIGAAGPNPDGSWGLNVVNLTGEPNSGNNLRPIRAMPSISRPRPTTSPIMWRNWRMRAGSRSDCTARIPTCRMRTRGRY